MNTPKYIKNQSTTRLEAELKTLNNLIEEVECYGVQDLLLRDVIEQELERRIQ